MLDFRFDRCKDRDRGSHPSCDRRRRLFLKYTHVHANVNWNNREKQEKQKKQEENVVKVESAVRRNRFGKVVRVPMYVS